MAEPKPVPYRIMDAAAPWVLLLGLAWMVVIMGLIVPAFMAIDAYKAWTGHTCECAEVSDG